MGDMVIFSLRAEKEIEVEHLKQLRRQKLRLMEEAAPKGYRTGTSYVDADNIHGNRSPAFVDILPKIMMMDQEICNCENQIRVIEKAEKLIMDRALGLNKTEKVVTVLRDYVGLNLREIAEVLGYDYGYIRKISAKRRNRLENNDLEKDVL